MNAEELLDKCCTDYDQCYIVGQELYLYGEPGSEARKQGLKLLLKACDGRNAHAQLMIAKLLLDNIIRLKEGDSVQHAVRLLYLAAQSGLTTAQVLLDLVCEDRYSDEHLSKSYRMNKNINLRGPLVDFSNKPIVINRSGPFTPVDMTLAYSNGKNRLTIDVNLSFLIDEDPYWNTFTEAVKAGILAWEGVYSVFGGQSVIVEIHISEEPRNRDTIFVLPVTEDFETATRLFSQVFSSNTVQSNITSLFDQGRSAASLGLRWSVYSKKVIIINQPDYQYGDYQEILNIAKHEFGHVLGVGDLYKETGHHEGIALGTYEELDGYHISDRCYNLVMCDHHGPISNNDIEMVILAFSRNKYQLYQPDTRHKKVSDALGKGN